MAAIQTCFRRYEKKYLLTPAQQEFILHGARGYMKEDAYGRYTICNIYYDTEDYSLIRSSLDKPVYKEKLRVRSYGTPQPQEDVFVEIKKKVDGIVYKRRVKLAAGLAPRYLAGDLALSPGGQISREIEWFQRFHRTQPRVFIGYDRMALAGTEQSGLRMTRSLCSVCARWISAAQTDRSASCASRSRRTSITTASLTIFSRATPIRLRSSASRPAAWARSTSCATASASRARRCRRHFLTSCAAAMAI